MKNRYSARFALLISIILLALTVPGARRILAAAATFSDVPAQHWAYDYIEELYRQGYVEGCETSPPKYCPDRALTRAEMAVFIVRGVHGASYTPPDPTEQIFDDVPLEGYWATKWIHQLYNDGYTAGCSESPPLYCPEDPHTRAEATVFFLRMCNGVGYAPPPPTGIFADVPTSTWYARWVEAAYSVGLIPACRAIPENEKRFCPNAHLIRAMAAYMMVRAKNLMTPSTDIVADGLEVTQAVQDLNNSVRLVANKQTFVRFHVHSSSGNHFTTARLRVQRGGAVSWLSPLNDQIYVNSSPRRTILNHAFLFELPSYYTIGTVSLMAEVNSGTATRGRAPLETSYLNNTTAPVIVSFEQVPRVNLVIYRLGYRLAGTPYTPNSLHVAHLEGWLKRAYPLSDLHSWHRLVTPFDHLPTCNEANDYLSARMIVDRNNGTVPEGTRYYGMVDDRGALMEESCADGIPSLVASGATGTPGDNYDSSWDIDDSYGDWLAGHELAHTYGRRHIRGGPVSGVCGLEGGAETVYPDGKISPTDSGDRALHGFDIDTNKIYAPWWRDVMTYCRLEWVSDYTYEGLMDYFLGHLISVTVDHRSLNQTDRLLVVGSINPEVNQVNLQPLFIMSNAGELEERIPGDYAIVLRNASGTELAHYPFTPDEVTDVHMLSISELVPYVTGTTQVDIEGPGGLLTSVSAGAAEPTVTLTTPNGGETLDGNTITVLWIASDPDVDPLTFYVEYSPDNGASWRSAAWNITGTTVEIDAINIVGGAQGRFRVWVSDGIHTASDESDAPFTVPNRVPTVEITAPSDDVTVAISQTVGFEAYAYDVDTGTMDDSQLQWFSDINGLLGNGSQFSTADLSEDTHTITFLADDGVGAMVSDTVQVTVVSDVTQIPLPPDGLSAGPAPIFFEPAIGMTSAQLSIDNRNLVNPIAWNAVADEPWLQLSASSGTTPDDIIVTFQDTGLPEGTHTATITLISPAVPNESVIIDVEVTITLNYIYLPLIVK